MQGSAGRVLVCKVAEFESAMELKMFLGNRGCALEKVWGPYLSPLSLFPLAFLAHDVTTGSDVCL